MDVNAPQWDAYFERFQQVAEQAEHLAGPHPEAASAEMILFLYGENGLSPEDEFAMLEKMNARAKELKRIEVDTSYWQDTALFIP